MRFFCPQLMDHVDEADKETFLSLVLKKRPEYAIVWDVTGQDIIEFSKRVWVTQYIAIEGKIAYYSQARHYATRAKALFDLDDLVFVDKEEDWAKVLPAGDKFKLIKYYSPEVSPLPTEIALEDFIQKMLKIRPTFVVLWQVSLEEVDYIASRVWVPCYLPVIDDIIYYMYGKHFAHQMQKKFNIKKAARIPMRSFLLEVTP